ncbi:hypothetical protein PCANC_00089 [Puccinia coronata f. sp. avenae]|uniref:UDP-galactose transporter n=1 Tax=Puccinia coronata f. sp. avenae TaxID=200324 RepID=A0A2N5W8G5_9BASI|nr:hypothetical protein PCANC_00089 [Puccinia coronata f. sp. avenae]
MNPSMSMSCSSFLSSPYLSFSLLVLHQSSISLIKQSRISASGNQYDSDLYNPATAIFLTEVLKASISLSILLFQSSLPLPLLLRSPLLFFAHLRQELFSALGPHHAHQFLELSFPAILYTLQNHLLYISVSRLDTPIFLITSQLKILTTALSSVLICQRVLVRQQWIALWVLTLGVIMVQFEPIEPNKAHHSVLFVLRPNQLSGICALVLSCLASGLAGAWFERALKLSPPPITIYPSSSSSPATVLNNEEPKDNTKSVFRAFPLASRSSAHAPPSLWTKNLQLSVPSLVVSYLMIYLEPHSRRHTLTNGFFYGFLPDSSRALSPGHSSRAPHLRWVWLIILYHSIGGLLVSIIVKQSGSLVKNFATCFSIVCQFPLPSGLTKEQSHTHPL